MTITSISSKLWSGYALPTLRQNRKNPAFSKPRQEST